MLKNKRFFAMMTVVLAVTVLTGCVERRLTVVTEPSEAIVWLNDEEIGTTPVTVSFNWYGDYYVRIEKPGYAILNTHRLLERPRHDKFPMDFFAEVLWPKTIEDNYTWSFELQPYQAADPDELIEAAAKMRQQAKDELGKTAIEVLSDEIK